MLAPFGFLKGSASIPTGNLVLYQRFDYTVKDDTGNHTPVGSGITYSTGIYSGDSNQSALFNSAYNSGSDVVYVPDSDLLSFGDGSTDSDFGYTINVNFTDNMPGAQRLIHKGALTTNTLNEYQVNTNPSGYIQFILFDSSTGGYIGVRGGTALSSATDYVIEVGYDGSGTAAGITIKINTIEESYTDISSGSYTAMENLGGVLRIGKRHDAGQNFRGRIGSLALWNKKLTQAEGDAVYYELINGRKLQYLTTPSSVAPRQLRYNANNPLYQWASGDQYRDPSEIFEFNGSFYFYASQFTQLTFSGDTSEEIAVFKSSSYNGTYTNEGVVLSISASDMDDKAIFAPCVYIDGSTIYMFYTGNGTALSSRWNIFCASSTDPEGTFTRVQALPILYNSTDGAGESWEDYRVNPGSICVKSDGTLRLYYKGVSGSSGGGVTGRAFGYADFTTFPTALTKATADNPFFDSTDSFDGQDPEDPVVWYQGGKYWMLYVTASPTTGIALLNSDNGVSSWANEYVVEQADLPYNYSRLHGATVYLDNGQLKASIFHEEAAAEDARVMSVLTYI